MSDQDKQEAAELAARAATQGKHAVRNTGRAGRAAALHAADVTESVAEETVEAVSETTKHVGSRLFSKITSDTSIGFLAMSVSIYAGVIALNKFGLAISRRNAVPGHVTYKGISTPRGNAA
jgi:hypothetical protein